MPILLICCASLPPATLSSVPIHDFAIANGELADEETEQYYPCCGKSICGGCVHSCRQSGDDVKCPFCNSDRTDKTDEEIVGELMKRAEANDAASIYVLASFYQHGLNGFQQDHAKAIEFYARAAELGYSKAHYCLGNIYDLGGDLKKARFHFEAAAMAGNEVARYNIGNLEFKSGNINRAVKHWTIAASVGHYKAMHNLLVALKKGYVSTESIDSTLAAYNSSCVEMSYETREAYIRVIMGMDESTNNT
jgi:TPR repeat protein